MESNQLFIEDAEKVKNIVQLVTGSNIFERNRKRGVVEARMLYGILLYELGYTFKGIGRTINKDHTTIIHYTRSIKDLIETDNNIAKKYLKCKKMLLLETTSDDLADYEIRRIKDELHIAKQEIELLTKEREELISEYTHKKDKRMTKIFKLLEDNTPVGHELIIERKLIKFFDE
jgi:hypothetical protein